MLWTYVFSNEVRQPGASLGLLLLRVTLGAMMIGIHGWPKLRNFKTELSKIEDPFGLGALPTLIMTLAQELGLSLLIILGLATRLSCLPMAATMIIAGFVVHRDWTLEKRQFIILYLLGFLVLALAGAGQFSLDELITQRWIS